MRLYQMADHVRYGLMNTEELRETFLLEELFQPGEIEFAYVDLDRTVIGSAVPTGKALKLETEPELRALMETVHTHHPYQVPEIVALPIVAGSEKYLNWLMTEVQKTDR